MNPMLTAFSLAGALVGPYLSWLGYLNYREAKRMDRIDTTLTRNVRPNSTVEITGTVSDPKESLTAPVTGNDAVVVVWRVDTWNEYGDINMWNPSALGVTASPFSIADNYGKQPVRIGTHVHNLGSPGLSNFWQKLKGLGRVFRIGQDRVRGGYADNDLTVDMGSWDDLLEVPAEEDPPASVESFFEEVQAVGESPQSWITNILDIGYKHGRRRYRESVIRTGDEVYVRGTTTPQNKLSPQAGEFHIGRGSEEDVAAVKWSRAKRALVLGPIFSVLGIIGLTYLFV